MIFYVVGYLFDHDNKHVALIKKIKPKDQFNMYNGIGGKIEPIDKDIQAAMSREFFEESGLHIPNWIHAITINAPDYALYVFKQNVPLELLNTVKSVEEEEVKVFSLDKLPENLYNNNKWVIPFLINKSYNLPIHIYHVDTQLY